MKPVKKYFVYMYKHYILFYNKVYQLRCHKCIKYEYIFLCGYAHLEVIIKVFF